MRNKNAASVADNDHLLDPLRRAVARCTRAVARKKNLEIVFDAGRPTADAYLVVLPPVCTDNLNAGVAVMKSAEDGA